MTEGGTQSISARGVVGSPGRSAMGRAGSQLTGTLHKFLPSWPAPPPVPDTHSASLLLPSRPFRVLQVSQGPRGPCQKSCPWPLPHVPGRALACPHSQPAAAAVIIAHCVLGVINVDQLDEIFIKWVRGSASGCSRGSFPLESDTGKLRA